MQFKRVSEEYGTIGRLWYSLLFIWFIWLLMTIYVLLFISMKVGWASADSMSATAMFLLFFSPVLFSRASRFTLSIFARLLLFLFCVTLWFLLRGVSCWVVLCVCVFQSITSLGSCLALCFRVFQSSLALWSPRLGKRELVYVLLVHLFVCLARVNFCPFSFPLGLGGWPWHVIVTLPGLVY